MEQWDRYGKPYGFRVSPELWPYLEDAAESKGKRGNAYARKVLERHARYLRRKAERREQANG